MNFSQSFSLGSYKTIQRELTKEEKLLITRVFHGTDESDKGYLNREDVKVAVIELMGYKPSKYEVTQLMQSHGEEFDTELGLSLDGFLVALGDKVKRKDENEEIRQTFLAFDVQCRGFLTAEDTRKVFGQVAPHIPAHTVDTNFRELDRDGDGRISYKDFEFMMKYDTSDHI
ncbi:hypothetical protein ScPMuIL_013790 [Solemya velum]